MVRYQIRNSNTFDNAVFSATEHQIQNISTNVRAFEHIGQAKSSSGIYLALVFFLMFTNSTGEQACSAVLSLFCMLVNVIDPQILKSWSILLIPNLGS
jgi:hypothetical protein